jgi:hypothetical protein
MNRKDRRAAGGHGKLSRDATREEILPAGHGPVQRNLVDTMTDVVKVLGQHLGKNYDVTLFVAERLPADGSDRLPRFNYISTAARPDMIAVLDAFAAKQKAMGETLDKIADAPPTETQQ